jgi:hypothetical protein
MRYFWMVVLAALAGQAPAGQASTGQAPAKQVEFGEPVRFGFAGVKMALPVKFEPLSPGDQETVFQTVLTEQDKRTVSLSLMAQARPRDMTLRKFVTAIAMELNSQLTIRNLKILKSKRLPVAGTEGEAQVHSYRYRGIDRTALRMFFLRPVPNADIQMAYILTAEAEKAHGRRLSPVLGAVANTIELFDPVRPASQKVNELAPPLVARHLGYSFRPPLWWKVRQRMGGTAVSMFQWDYLKNEPGPQGALRVAQETVSAAEWGQKALEQHIANLKRDNVEHRVLRQGPAKMGGQDGYEFVVRHKDARGGKDEIVYAERVACANGMQYTLRMYYPGGKEELVVAAAETTAAGMELFPPEMPTTATAPAAPPATLPSTTLPASP